MENNLIYPTEKSVLNHMKEQGIKKLKMFITAYVDHSNYQQWGWSLQNVNSDYYFNQKCISNKTEVFAID
jgi:hypothetical protein